MVLSDLTHSTGLLQIFQMPSSFSLLPPWRDTLTETTTTRQNLVDSDGNKMTIQKRYILNRKQP